MWTLDPACVEALAGSCQVARAIEVHDSNGIFLEDITYAVTAGQVFEDETAQVRRTCTLTLNDPALVPSLPTDLLHPLSGNELWIFKGAQPPSGTASVANGWLAPMGIFRMSQPTTTDDDAGLSLAISGNDRSAAIAAQTWTGPYTGGGGQFVQTAIQAIISDRWSGPPLTYNMYPSTVVVPTGTTFGIQFTAYGTTAESGSTSGGNNPWQDCVNLALSAGCELLFDRQGIVVMRPVPEPSTVPVVVNFTEGPGCTVVAATRELDETAFFNGVIVIGTGTTVTNGDTSSSPGAPVVGEAWSTDPVLGPDGPLGPQPDFITDETVSTGAEAIAAANAQLPLVMSALDEPSLQAVANPALDAGDANGLIRARMKLSGVYIVSAVTHPLDAVTAMQVTERSYAVAA